MQFLTKVDLFAASASVVAGFASYLAVRLYNGPHLPGLTLQPQLSAGTLKGFLLGHLADALDRRYGPDHSAQQRWCSDVNKVGFTKFGLGNRVFTANPDDMDHCLNEKMRNFRKGRGYVILRRILGNGLVTNFDDDSHAIHRREVGPAFSPNALKDIADNCIPKHAAGLLAAVEQRVRKAVTNGDQGSKIAVMDLLSDAALHIMAEAAFKTTDPASLEECAANFHMAMTNGWSLARLLPILDRSMVKQNRLVQVARGNMAKLVSRIHTAVLSGKEEEVKTKKYLVDYLMLSEKLSIGDVTDHSITFLFAGFDTTSNALTWFLYHISKHQPEQEKLFEEVSSVFGLGTIPTLDDLKSCSYLVNSIKENLRCLNPVRAVARQLVVDDVLPGTKTFLPAGTHVILNIHSMHVSPQLWGPDAAEFKPERWERPETEKIAERAFLPFSTGRRNCIGKDFAMNEMKVLVAVLIRNYQFTWPADEPEPETVSTPIVKPKVPFRLLVQPRDR
jgi:cytochrome P450